MVSVLENRLDGELKEIADLEVKLLIRRTRARALEKAVEAQKLREVRKLVQKLHNPRFFVYCLSLPRSGATWRSCAYL